MIFTIQMVHTTPGAFASPKEDGGVERVECDVTFSVTATFNGVPLDAGITTTLGMVQEQIPAHRDCDWSMFIVPGDDEAVVAFNQMMRETSELDSASQTGFIN